MAENYKTWAKFGRYLGMGLMFTGTILDFDPIITCGALSYLYSALGEQNIMLAKKHDEEIEKLTKTISELEKKISSDN
ncbi:MAG: hypothetical protein PHD81_00180 [Candidatus Nanoarchaeia archaeon]|nr:hypothetical protein [Candidatus Nanoarchaeia archaeon]MDD5587509.1 hypothetical protein [Candidatus Nanoarchaeia archaeon]